MITTLTKEKTQLIDGPAGKLEIALSAPIAEERNAWGIVCHPHPLHGGTMYNKVVTTLAKTFQHMGVATVRFNFRGVMRSEGTFDQGNGELDDLLAVIDWVQRERTKTEMWIAGFSFGGYIAIKAAAQVPVDKLVTVAPSVEHFSMQHLSPISAQWVLVQGDLDEIVPPEAVLAWAKSRDPQPTIIRFPKAGHFFHGELMALSAQITAALRTK